MLDRIIERYDALFLDAYGVLVDASGPIKHGTEFVKRLNDQQKPFRMLTNDASRLHSSISQRLSGYGIEIPEDKIISSGSLLKPYFEQHNLRGARCCVLGTADSHSFATIAGAVLVDPIKDSEFDVLILADESGYPFFESIDAVISHLIQMIATGKTPQLILPNPDLLYPKASKMCGLAAGSLALMIESALQLRFGDKNQFKFDRLGKPQAMIFEKGCAELGSRNVLMVGDQLSTDVLGAKNFGLDSLLLLTGLTQSAPDKREALQATYVLPDLQGMRA
jgi:HAD superfamily hydrolase (TIGR01450 family)